MTDPKQQAQQQKPQQPAQPPRPLPLEVYISVDAAGAIKIQGKPDALQRLAKNFETAVQRLEGGMGGDGSITVACKAGKGVTTLTVIAY